MQDVVSAATGIAVAVALVRGLAGDRASTVGNFWVDLVRSCLRVLLPLAVVGALVLVAGGVVQNLAGYTDVTTLTGGAQSVPGGTVASQEAIKLLGTNGGGYYNANSTHPFESPSGWVSMLQVLMILLIPFSLPRAFGRMVGDMRQGRAILAAMVTLFVVSICALGYLELSGHGAAPQLAGGPMEGKEVRFGLAQSVLYAGSTTLTSTGAVSSMHDSYTALGGMVRWSTCSSARSRRAASARGCTGCSPSSPSSPSSSRGCSSGARRSTSARRSGRAR